MLLLISQCKQKEWQSTSNNMVALANDAVPSRIRSFSQISTLGKFSQQTHFRCKKILADIAHVIFEALDPFMQGGEAHRAAKTENRYFTCDGRAEAKDS